MKRVIDLVDSVEYATTNCFVHQLTNHITRIPGVETVELGALGRQPKPDAIVCRLKQRTLHRVLPELSAYAGKIPVVVFDQDPWHAFMDNSPYKGVYQRALEHLNVKAFAVTTQSWVDLIKQRGMPAIFASMWIEPEYCEIGPGYTDRSIRVGFVGSVHSYRQRLFDRLDDLEVQVNVQSGNTLPYRDYLRALHNIRVYIHSEDAPLLVDGQEMNLKDGLWMRDVEVAARGCFSIRNKGVGSETYWQGIETVMTYDDPDQVPELLNAIEKMDAWERQATINRSVEYIRRSNRWQETARRLVETATAKEGTIVT